MGSPRPERRLWRPDVRQDVDDEIAFHLAEREREYAERGMADAAARDAARQRFGDVAKVATACRHIDERWYSEQRRANMWADLRQDISYAVRSLGKSPGFAAVTILTLALGIGANTAIFSVIHSVLLQPLPYRDSGRLVFVWSSSTAFPREPLTPGRLVDFREQMTSVTQMAGISHVPLNLTGAGDPERLSGSSVTSAFFDVLGVPPLLGETFHDGRADDRDVVLSYGLWNRRFGGDRAIVGKQIAINGTARTVVAVMPQEFGWPSITAMPSNVAGPELWIPGTSRDIPRMPIDRPDQDLAANRRSGYLRAVARLKDGMTVAQAQREAETIAARLAQQYPIEDGSRGSVVTEMREQFFGPVRQPMLVLVGAVVFVLAIACANVASLLLGRATSRRKEIAVRLALGATRGRVVRQLLAESVLLSLTGAACGLIVAAWAQVWLIRLSPGGVLRLDQTRLDPVVLGFTLALAVVTGVVFGLIPAWQGSAGVPNTDLNDGGTRASAAPRAGRTRDVLVAGEVCVAVILLVGAGLLLRSFSALSRVDTGLDTHNLLTFEMFLSGGRAEYQSRQVEFYNQTLAEISALPGVRAAGAAVTLPIGGDDFAAGFLIEGRPVPAPGQEPRAGYQVVTPGYFHAMGIPIVSGRDFRPGDTREAPPSAMVNQTFARQQWPGEEAIGRRFKIGRGTDTWMTVVGVVGDIRHLGPATPPRPEFYQPHSQNSFPFMAFVVRTTGDPHSVVPSIRSAVARLDPSQPISGASTMEEHITRSLSRPRFMSTLVTVFGALALGLSIVGIYGVMSYSVAQRTREIAIRSALGARASDLMRLILSKALWLSAAGIVVGVAGALALSRVLGGLLFDVQPTDPLTYTTVAVLLATVAPSAAAIPAWRAMRIDGTKVLRF